MLRFLAGILLVQAASVAVVLVTDVDMGDWSSWLPILVALGSISLVSAFWFTTVATNLRRNEVSRVRTEFARERENLRVKAERDKTRMVRKGQKDMASATRRAESRANRKVALAVTAAGAAGLVMLMTSFMTVGFALLSGAGGAMGGYLFGRERASGKVEGGGEGGSMPRRRWLRLPTSAASRDERDQSGY